MIVQLRQCMRTDERYVELGRVSGQKSSQTGLVSPSHGVWSGRISTDKGTAKDSRYKSDTQPHATYMCWLCYLRWSCGSAALSRIITL